MPCYGGLNVTPGFPDEDRQRRQQKECHLSSGLSRNRQHEPLLGFEPRHVRQRNELWAAVVGTLL